MNTIMVTAMNKKEDEISIFDIIRSIPKILYVNFKALPIKQAIYFPILVSYNTIINSIEKGSIVVDVIKTGCIKIGFGGTLGVPPLMRYGKSFLDIGHGGQMCFKGYAKFASGNSIRVHGGVMDIGNAFSSNVNCQFTCNCGMSFGDNVLLGWDVNIRDSDNHVLIQNGIRSDINQKPISIGNHVWICSHSDILKGVTIKDNSIVAWRACVTKPILEEDVLIAGIPAEIIKHGYSWDYS